MPLADSQAGSTAIGIIVWIVLVAVYWSPTIVGAIARKHNLGTIAVWNLFAFFFFFPWILAWVKVAEKPQPPVIIQQPPGYYYPPPQRPYDQRQ